MSGWTTFSTVGFFWPIKKKRVIVWYIADVINWTSDNFFLWTFLHLEMLSLLVSLIKFRIRTFLTISMWIFYIYHCLLSHCSLAILLKLTWMMKWQQVCGSCIATSKPTPAGGWEWRGLWWTGSCPIRSCYHLPLISQSVEHWPFSI